ncbi:MAG: transcription elongation factor GreA [Hyphomicrobium sp.]
MSRAFVKEGEGDDTAGDLPDRLISPHRNLVTSEGLALIDAACARFAEDYALAQANSDRAALSHIARDLRYWTARRASAEVVADPSNARDAQFGARVTLMRDDGRRQIYRIVGEDEADPSKGTLSYVSPLAQALMGKGVGDTVTVGAHELEIIAIA